MNRSDRLHLFENEAQMLVPIIPIKYFDDRKERLAKMATKTQNARGLSEDYTDNTICPTVCAISRTANGF